MPPGRANDLRRHGLAVDGGRTRGNEEVRILTPAGLAAAAAGPEREIEEMGGIPRGAGRSGASHPMTVNETVIALIRPKPDLDLVAGEPEEAVAVARTAARAPDGIGTLTSYATEVALPVKGTWKNPAIGSARADIVVTAPGDGVPLLFIEADNCTEEAALVAAKFDKYARFFQRKEKDTDDSVKLMWRTRWSAPSGEGYERAHPPVLLVFHHVGRRSAKKQMEAVAALTRHHWKGHWDSEDGCHSYDGRIPIVATTLDQLREHGPAGPVFWRFGRKELQPLLDAIGNPRLDAALTRRRQAAREEQQRRDEQQAAAREAERPVCARCGTRFTDERWQLTRRSSWRSETDNLCGPCESGHFAQLEVERVARRAAEEAAAGAAAEAEAKKNRRRFRRQ
ncbi:replication-relaxation family protein [Streptomyces sp. NPDC094049]|uniref:replication-relaxation family protein n=1 Tax=Streptomyces sp. NPDC094049 TaxID=3154987 RepID=UPI00331D9ABF